MADDPIYPTAQDCVFPVARDEWLAVLPSAGFCETLVTELRLPADGPDATADARQRLAHAVDARNQGSYAEAMRRCRIASDALKKSGFGGKAPIAVATFLSERAGTMNQAERFSALMIAFQMYLSPAAHANAPEEDYGRDEADVALEVTALLIRLAARHDIPGS